MPVLMAAAVVAGFTGLCGHFTAEQRRHFRNLGKIENRILVNGIRGKSSTTRLVAAGLRADPLNTVSAKTTGTAARMIYPDAHETPIERRHGLVNVIEQVGVVAEAARLKSTHLVVECMAVDPELQRFNQAKLIRSSIGVITNVRMDHVDEMGPTLRDIARSLAGTMPVGGVCVTAEDRIWKTLKEEADKRDCKLLYADPDLVTDAEMARFPYLTFPGNVACALAVAELCRVPREIALAEMWVADPDPGVLRVDLIPHEGNTIRAANLFAANDPESTVDNLELLRARGMIGGRLSIVINCRPDRVERNGQMGGIVEALNADRVFLIGAPTRSAMATIPPLMRDRVVDLEGEHHSGDELRKLISAKLFDDPDEKDESLVMVGNIHGRGEELLAALEKDAVAAPLSAAPARPKVSVDLELTVHIPAPRTPADRTAVLDLTVRDGLPSAAATAVLIRPPHLLDAHRPALPVPTGSIYRSYPPGEPGRHRRNRRTEPQEQHQ